ncbi:hypothetical protein FNV43_RR16312 [Rhamnella rubrinervis]|uniref:RNase H type-1 domain-containing protein n=1 Tax=Rhamnella rubrinervis TaxID=2594499 RepID=A0A8K0GYJ9_9ROSA|nr:hypothetical protein FNV43_RR16312 [Rhamnella rubrinervis]
MNSKDSVLDRLSVDRLEDSPISAPISFPSDACIVHTGIAVGKEETAFAMAILDCKGNLISLASKLTTVLTPHLAEIKALEWATDLIERRGYPRVVWFCDSQVVVKEVKDSNESNSWFAYNEILNVRHAFAGKQWSLFWTSRNRNLLADLIAKTTLSSSSVFYFDFCCRDTIPLIF